MSTQTKILLGIVVLFLILIGGLFTAYQYYKENGGSTQTTGEKGGGSLFPDSSFFGGIGLERREEESRDVPVPTLRQISSAPTAGGIVFSVDGKTMIRYVERATGHVFETATDSLEVRRVSNTTIPRIQEAVFSPDGESVILRYLDENENLKSFYGAVKKENGSLDGWFLDNRILDIAIDEDGGMFYIQRVGNEGQGIVSDFDGTNGRAVFSSSIYDWSAEWAGGRVTLTTKPANNILGFLYELESGRLISILSGDGLDTLPSKDGTLVLFSTSDANGTTLFLHDRGSGATTRVPFRTLAQKCAWATNTIFYCASPYDVEQNATYPDDWHKGVASFSDDIWSYDTRAESERLVYDAEADGKIFDATLLTVDEKGGVLLFMNKKDLTPWMLLLEK